MPAFLSFNDALNLYNHFYHETLRNWFLIKVWAQTYQWFTGSYQLGRFVRHGVSSREGGTALSRSTTRSFSIYCDGCVDFQSGCSCLPLQVAPSSVLDGHSTAERISNSHHSPGETSLFRWQGLDPVSGQHTDFRSTAVWHAGTVQDRRGLFRYCRSQPGLCPMPCSHSVYSWIQPGFSWVEHLQDVSSVCLGEHCRSHHCS